jgi:septal ring factor EnvC (AmiA/AmiB activator)
MTLRHFFLPLILLLFSATIATAQDFEQMRAVVKQRQAEARIEIDQLMSQIDRFQQQILDVGTRYDQLFRQYQNTQRELALRDEVLRKLTAEQRAIQNDIALTEEEVRKRQRELDQLIESYKKNITYVYKHGRIPELAMILSAGSLDQMMARAYYLRRFEEHRQKQATAIRVAQGELEIRKEELIVSRQENERSVNESTRERQQMETRRQQQNRTIQTLQRDRRSTQQKLDETKRQVQNLNKILEDAIAEEERIQRAEAARIAELEAERLRRLAEARQITDAARREAEIERYSTPITAPSTAPSADAMASLESSFASLKGQLQWPVRRGVISIPFGDIVDPVYRTRVPNEGVEMTTGSREPVYAIHDGFISAGGQLVAPKYGTLLILYHGDYKTIYGNLSEVIVPPGTFVRAGDLIGYGGTSLSPMGESIFFMVRKGKTNLDPAQWITPRQASNP